MRWDTFEEMRDLEKRMNRAMRNFWGGTSRTALPAAEGTTQEWAVEPYTDIVDKEGELVLTADIPGVNKDDIKINISDGNIEISAETKKEEKEEKEGYIRRERSFGRYFRSYSLPAAVNFEDVKASYKNGVLEVHMPKSEEKKGKSIKVD
jgi:HSP20 family protein